MLKKIALGGIVVFAFLAYALHHQTEQTQTVVSMPMRPMMMHKTSYKDGTYTGSVADAFYGNVQVQTTITNGKITDVQFLDYPHDRPTSVEINSQAMSLLKQEAITAQNSQVDIISGATQTSDAFIQSLASALSQAQQ